MTAVAEDMNEQELASDAIDIQRQLNQLNERLSKVKEALRELAKGSTKEILVDGAGKVSISVPFAGSEIEILILDELKLNDQPDLKQRLIDEGIAKKDIKRVPACVAKVTIKPT